MWKYIHSASDLWDHEDDDSKIFPQRLMEILSQDENADAICWLPHGRAFIVKDRQLFSDTIMPRFFSRKAKYSSFTRKLNRWNFVRVSCGPEIGAYYHEFFLRDKPQLAAQMFCKNARSKAAMAAAEVAAPPKQEAATYQEVPAQLQSHNAQPVIQLPPDIPLALLEVLSKGPSVAPSQQEGAPNRMLQQSQYANLLLERQIQILQEEQAKRMAMQQALLMHSNTSSHEQDAKPNAQKLVRMQQIMAQNQQQQQRKNTTPTSHRAHAA